MANYKEICDWYITKIIPSPEYNVENGIKKPDLLYPAFRAKVEAATKEFNKKYPQMKLVYVETYRSNARQLMHFNNGASKIKKNGMHHFGIAVDCAFVYDTDGDGDTEFTYEGDYPYLRQCWLQQGLKLLGLWDKGHCQFIDADNDQVELRAEIVHAVKQFQKSNGLVDDGIIGKRTIAKAKELYG